jgi:hypothetical protein
MREDAAVDGEVGGEFKESARLEKEIRENLQGFEYGE